MSTLKTQLVEIRNLLDEQVLLARFAALEDRTLQFNSYGKTVRLYLPDGQVDFVQRVILKGRNFYEWRQLAALRDLNLIDPNTQVLDVGANIGNHTVFFGKVLGAKRVVCCEPQQHAFDILTRNIEKNGLSSCIPVNAMVGREVGKGQLSSFNPGNYGGTKFQAADAGDTDMTSVDNLRVIHGKFGFIKIDVEGFESEVLAGAQATLQEDKPTIWLECNNGEADVAIYLSKHLPKGYKPVKLSRVDYLFVPDNGK